ncbi:MAG: hypothetical protein QXN37_03025 [Candidatus Anstonellaceae archaeon]
MLGYMLTLAIQQSPFYEYIFFAFALAISIIVIAFMAGEFFSNPPLKAFAKGEASELIVSAIVLLLAFLLATPGGIFDIVAEGFILHGVPPDRVCPEWAAKHGPFTNGKWSNGNLAYAQADYFLGCRPQLIFSFYPIVAEGVILNKLILGYNALMLNEFVIGLLSTLSTGFSLPILYPFMKLDVSLAPWIAMVPLNDVHTALVDILGATIASVMAQKLLLTFIEETALSVFLPFGLVLRAFPLTRKTGSTIIAVVFAAYFVYPITILINQQIWEMIANPQPQPGGPKCLTNDQPCNTDSECCSLNCRNKPSSQTKVCASPLTDFSEYSSIFSICYGKSPDEVNRILEQQARRQEENFLDIYARGSASSGQWTKTEQRVKEAWEEIKRRGALILRDWDAFLFPHPKKASIAVMKLVEVVVTDVMHFTMVTILFLVNEIIITLTLMKDFALLIGGEPRVFGISKLV